MIPEYALITPARNEEENIEKTLQSVVEQTHLPARWVIVNDFSTDRTAEIVERFIRNHPFITLVNSQKHNALGFGSKAKAFDAGYAELGKVQYSFIGNLDGDVSFNHTYFENLLQQFAEDPKLGLGGGLILERIEERFIPQRISANSVAGAVQMFRRECFESVGGYLPLKRGGIDSVAEIMARMHGWKVRTFWELQVEHHGRVTTGERSLLRTRFNKGMNNYLIGYDPAFHFVASVFRCASRPYLLGGLMMLTGYCWAAVRRNPRPVPQEFVRFLRQEQRDRMRSVLGRVSLSGETDISMTGIRRIE